MPTDIRSFFGPKKSSSKNENEKKQPSKSSSNKKKLEDLKNDEKKKKRRIIVDSESDSEEPLPTKLRKDKPEEKKKSSNTMTKKGQDKKQKKEEKVLKPTTATDFFGSSSTASNTDSNSRKRKQSGSPEKRKESEKLKMEDNESPIPAKVNNKPPHKKMKVNDEVKSPSQKKEKKVESRSKLKNEAKNTVKNDDICEKLVINIDVEVIEPTPPPVKKTANKTSKTSKLSAKLSTKVKDSKENGNKEMVETEEKMKDKLKEYLHDAKDNKSSSRQKKGNSPKTKQAIENNNTILAPETNNTILAPETPHNETPGGKKNYWQYKNRDGPSALGSKELPEGGVDCLEGFTFVITGVLDAFERDDVADHIKRYGGKVTSNVSGKTSYVIVGKEPGASKMEKAAKHKTKQLDEDGFIALVASRPGKSSNKGGTSLRKESITTTPIRIDSTKKSSNTTPSSAFSTPLSNERPKLEGTPALNTSSSSPSQSQSSKTFTPKSLSMSTPQSKSDSQSSGYTQSPGIPSQSGASEFLLWVDKYKPQRMKDIVGQHGDRSNANKLKKWLLNWKANNSVSSNQNPKKNYMAGKEDGSIFKAALLSGPPGVGKTTTATIVCKDVGFSFIEMNASDTRGKKALDTVIKESLSNVNVVGMMQGDQSGGLDHVLIMDEVDGMAGNEDRGGMQELIQLIKKSKIPIICMCNDRNHPKVRSLANYCFDLRFYKPKVEQIKAFALKIACRQGMSIPQQAMEQIVVGANQDIRQVVHNLQMWSATKNSLTYDEAKESAKNATKNIKMGPFDIVKTLFTHGDSSKLNIHQKSDLFFNDYSFIPLFMQENYLSVNPKQGKNIHATLDLISKTADSIADGNRVESLIRGEQKWSLLPLQGLYSTVLPSMLMSGYLGGRIDFPQWLGKNSSRNKHDRILQELKTHLALSANCMKSDINLDYISTLKRRLGEPLVDTKTDANAAAKEVIDLLESYNLTREDWDSIMDIGKWGNEADITSKIPSKVKSAFTRQYNKESHKTPYAVHQTAKKTKVKATSTDDILVQEGDDVGEENPVDDDNEEEDVTKDAMVKVKKEPTTATKTKNTSKKPTKSTTSSKSKTGKGKKKAT